MIITRESKPKMAESKCGKAAGRKYEKQEPFIEIKIHVFFSAFTYLRVWSESLACNKYFDLHQSIKSQVTINPGAMVKSRLIAVDKKQCIADKPVRKNISWVVGFKPY